MPKVGSLLPAVQDGLESIAKSERRSVSWVIAEIVSDYFGLDCETNKSKPKLKSKYHVTAKSVTSKHPDNPHIKLIRPLKRRA